MSAKVLRLILGDQLNEQHSWFSSKDQNVTYCIMEMRQETDYVSHHIQKVTAFFHAMRSFAEKLKKEGHNVVYFKLNDKKNQHDLTKNLSELIDEEQFESFEYQYPDEYRLDEQLKSFCKDLEIDTKAVDSEHFLRKRLDLKEEFEGKKSILMERFYRKMRKEYDILMTDEDEPEGGEWNFDKENRKKYKGEDPIPEPKTFNKDVTSLVEMLEEQGVETIGRIDPKNFIWPTSREEGLEMLDFFAKECLPLFGKYQDALYTESWSMYHSRLSFLLNSKILSPLEVVERCVRSYKHSGKINLAQIEGFVRQIIGWREFMRGVYWWKMPDYAGLNYFEHKRKLPKWYWTGETNMKCLSEAVNNSLDHSYAHHIQRLMVTGNFALLAEVNPDEVDEWYLGIYIDAIEWVEITNTRGMALFADGGIVGSKPYVSSANYIDKMSNYCKNCFYSKSKKTGEGACPFNSLYWNFYDRNRDKLGNNPRIAMMYRTWDKQQADQKSDILKTAERYLNNLDSL